jgi:L-rhamnose mutarotase
VQRICFELTVSPARLDEYRERHAAVWPSMLREIEASGRRNYSLFLRPDGHLIGYYEADDPQASTDYLATSAVAADWEREMAPFFLSLDGRPDQGATVIPEIFNLADQLAAAATDPARPNSHDRTAS